MITWKWKKNTITVVPALAIHTDSEDERDSRNMPEPAFTQRDVNMFQGCRGVDEFEILNKIDEGTYGVTYRAKDKNSEKLLH